MPKPWFPIAAVLAIGSAFALWESMNDYARARYYAILLGTPHTAFLVLGAAGHSGEVDLGKIRQQFRRIT